MSLLSKFKAHRLRSSSPHLDAISPDSRHPYLLSITIESPPVVLYGPSNESSGYLLSGLLFLTVPYHHPNFHLSSAPSGSPLRPSLSKNLSQASIDFELGPEISNSSHLIDNHITPSHSVTSTPVLAPSPSYNGPTAPTTTGPPLPESKQILIRLVTLLLNQVVTYGKPFLPPSTTLSNCSACKTKTTTLARWDVLSQPTIFTSGKQAFPFSHLLPGLLPQTTVLGSSGAFTVRYELVAESTATYETRSKKQKSANVKVKAPIRVSRSIIKGVDKHSLRIFPPSNVTVAAVIPNVVYPKADFIVELKLDGLNEAKKRWRLRRINWKIEEMAQVKANTCELAYHQTKLKVLESHIRLNNEHRVPNSAFVLGKNVRRAAQDSTTSQTPISSSPAVASGASATAAAVNMSNGPLPEEEEGQEIPSAAAAAAAAAADTSFIHPHDHVNQQSAAHYENTEDSKTEKNELFLQEVRVLEKGTLREGWKSDYSGSGTVDVAVDIKCKKLSTGLVNHINTVDSRSGPTSHIDRSLDIGNDANCSCDISDPELGIYVTHNLILEANLAEEVAQPIASNAGVGITHGGHVFREPKPKKHASTGNSTGNSDFSTLSPSSTDSSSNTTAKSPALAPRTSSTPMVPTGLTRLFRMRFKLVLTERSGFGISWDEEVPPQYSQVSTFSPPSYGEALLISDENELSELRI